MLQNPTPPYLGSNLDFANKTFNKGCGICLIHTPSISATSKTEITNALNLSKNKYFKRHGNKPNKRSTSSKTYWSVIKTLLIEKRLLSFLPC